MNKKTFRIGIDARFYGPLGKGLGRYTQEVVDNVLKMDRENEYVVFLCKENFDELKSDHPRLKKVLADVRWYTLKEQIEMPKLIAQEKLDLMHFPHFNVPFFCPTRFIVTVHDLILTKFPTTRASTLGPLLYYIKNFFYKIIIKRAIQRSVKVIAVSEYTKKDLLEHFRIKEDKIAVTLEGVAAMSAKGDSGFMAKTPSDHILSHYCILEPYLLYVGNAYPHKNLESLIRVLQKVRKTLPDMKLVLVGKSDYFYDRLQKYSEEVGGGGVIFPGYAPDRDLEVLFKHARAYVFPSKYEGFGLPPLEAMSRGCPVASSDSTCLPEVLGDAALYFNADDEDDMSTKIITIAQDAALREKLIAKGYKQVKKYDWVECARLTQKLYERALL